MPSELYRVHINQKYWGALYGVDAEAVLREVNQRLGSRAAEASILVRRDSDNQAEKTCLG